MASIEPPRIAAGLAVAALTALAGCTVVGGARSSPLPTSGPTMEQIYAAHKDRAGTGASTAQAARARLPLRPVTEYRPGPAREEPIRQLERRFVRVPNPDLVMTVFPHLAKGKYPVPGYVTAFPMYESVEYLLPGEASGDLDGLR
jgi:conjugative transfer region lipoprotein (TIGR03751 family)